MTDSLQDLDTSMDESRTDAVEADDLPLEPTEQQLRDAFDNDEIDRFLRLFSTYVQEVTVLDPAAGAIKAEISHKEDHSSNLTDEIPLQRTSEKERLSAETRTSSISEAIAKHWILPNLPPPQPSPQEFSISRLRTTAQRLYLTTREPYGCFFTNIFKLATWKEFRRSFLWCSLYWILWWHNLLFTGAVLAMLAVLLKRKVFLYPTLEELHRHREQVVNANTFGRQVSDRFTAPSSGLREIWHLFRLIESSRRKNITTAARKGKARANQSSTSFEDLEQSETSAEPTILDSDPNDQHEQDVKKAILVALSEIADLHERVRNVFIWRRPSVSVRYAIALCIIFVATLLPPQDFLKLLLFVIGVVFWHIVPIVASLSSEERSRLPPPFGDAPTDAEYAMELISERVSAGLEVRPRRLPKKVKGQQMTELQDAASETTDSSIDWKKWGNRLHTGKSAIGNLKRLNVGQVWPINESRPGQHPLIPSALGIAQPQVNVENHTYPCQHTSSPGLITVSPTTFFFTPLTSQVPTVSFPLSSVRGIKKQGLLKGLQIKWSDESEGHRETKEDKFIWVGSRDDLFARLVGTEGHKWATL